MAQTTPRQRVRDVVARDGERAVVTRCVQLLGGAPDPPLIEVLGGASAPYVLSGHEGGPGGYWPRTWALRALLYAWDPVAESAVVAACSDDHWRVREMAGKVLAARKPASGAARAALDRLAADDNHRVRAIGERATKSMNH